MEALSQTVGAIVTTSLSKLGLYIPQFLGGMVLLLIGLTVASLLKEIVIRFLVFLKIEDWLGSFSNWFEQVKTDTSVKGSVWPKLLSELVRWTVVILFLVPAAEAWGLPRVTELLNQVLLYIPNVFVAIVIGFIGLTVANLVFDLIKHASVSLGGKSSNLLAAIGRYSIIFFIALVVLNQLGVAADLIKILFTGIVAMLALAGGLAFGLGGTDVAKRVLSEFLKKIEK